MRNSQTNSGIGAGSDANVEGDTDENAVPLTRAEAEALRAGWGKFSLMRVFVAQAAAALLAVAACVAFGGTVATVQSVAWGAAACLLPSVVTGLAWRRGMRAGLHGVSLGRLLLWEGVKIVFSVGLLWAAPRWLAEVNWLALVLAFVWTVKAFWVGAWWGMSGAQRRRPG